MKAVRRFAIPLTVLAVTFACDRSPTGVSQSPASNAKLTAGRAAGSGGLVSMPCDPLASASVTQVIGRAGGSMRVGPHTLRVLQGALVHAVSITAELDGDDGSNKVRFYPHGLKFRTPAYLTMSYANCDIGDGSRLAYVQIVYRHGDQIVEYEPSVADLAGWTVTGEITHFSNYAVAW